MTTIGVRDSWLIDRDDARQERELRRLEGRSTKATLSQIRADLGRKRIDMRSGKRLVSIDAVSALDERSLGDKIAGERNEDSFEVSRDPWDRAFRLIDGVHEPTRTALHNVLEILRAQTTRRKIQLWRQQNPGRKATQKEIAIEIGVARETLVRNSAEKWKRVQHANGARARVAEWLEANPVERINRQDIAKATGVGIYLVYQVLRERREQGLPTPYPVAGPYGSVTKRINEFLDAHPSHGMTARKISEQLGVSRQMACKMIQQRMAKR